MSRQFPEAEVYKELAAKKNFMATQGIPVAKWKTLRDQNYVTTLLNYIPTESKKKLKEQIATENCKLR